LVLVIVHKGCLRKNGIKLRIPVIRPSCINLILMRLCTGISS
jgi:hypothetical protein